MSKTQYKDSQFTLSKEEVQKLINATKNERDKLIIETLYYTGMRRFEVAKLDVRDIDFERGRINVTGKGKKFAPIPVGAIFPEYMANLKRFLRNKKEGCVFLSNREKELELSRINQIVDEVAKDAGIKNPNKTKRHLNPHLLRHSIARHLKNDSYPLEFVQNYMRHDSITTTMDEYGTMSIDEMEKEANKINGR